MVVNYSFTCCRCQQYQHKEAILRYRNFLQIFDKIISLIGQSTNSDVKDYSKKVDDLLKDVVYRSLDKGLLFDLDQLIEVSWIS